MMPIPQGKAQFDVEITMLQPLTLIRRTVAGLATADLIHKAPLAQLGSRITGQQ